uniref:Uncharacterized protein n=1 Tax=Trichobilharzia regenti TaxID=157069 RepID=A0AA85JY89_TRIRE|nr:unnamed protein product [Trichobilharzia regenti]
MVVLQIKQERTYGLRLSTQNVNAQGCLIKEYEFDPDVCTFLKEIHFMNSYCKRVSAQLCYQETDTGESTWVELFKLELMKNAHLPRGACAHVKIMLPPTFETVKSTKRLLRLRVLLQQPSTIWKEFTIKNLQLFDEYLVHDKKETTGDGEGHNTSSVNEAHDNLGTLCSLIDYKQGARSSRYVSKPDISVLTNGHFETT